MIVAAYAASLLIVERLFRIVRTKLTTLGWFAKLWASYLALRNRVVPWSSRSTEADEAGPELAPIVDVALVTSHGSI